MTMMDIIGRRSVAKAAPQPKPVPTRAQLIGHVVMTLRQQHGKSSFGGIYNIEGRPENEMRAISVKGTPFEPVQMALVDAGAPSNHTVGGVMDTLKLTKDDLHDLICNCRGDTVTGDQLADRFEALPSRG